MHRDAGLLEHLPDRIRFVNRGRYVREIRSNISFISRSKEIFRLRANSDHRLFAPIIQERGFDLIRVFKIRSPNKKGNLIKRALSMLLPFISLNQRFTLN